MRLLVMPHLQPVLDDAQEIVTRRQFRQNILRHHAECMQGVQRLERAAYPQFRNPPAPDQLLRGGEKLDLANAADAGFDVMPRHDDLALARVHLPLDGVDVGDGGEIQRLAPDKGHQLAHEGLAGGDVARQRPRLDHSRALPVLADGFVIGEGGGGVDGRRGGHGVGPQAQVGAENIAVRRALLHDGDEVLRQPVHEMLLIARAGVRQLFGIEQQNKIDVAGIVQLETAQFAHAQYDDATALLRRILIHRREFAALMRCHQQKPHHRANGSAGEMR